MENIKFLYLSVVILMAFWVNILIPATVFARMHGAAAHRDHRVVQNESAMPPYVGFSGKYSVYDPIKDITPDEGLGVVETNFFFRGLLLVRPYTKGITVHHVGVPDGDISARWIHLAHRSNGWQGIGYHYVIRQNGVIERGRPLATIGAHAYGANERMVGINLSGNFDFERPTRKQLDSLIQLLAFLCRYYHLSVNEYTILGHREVNFDTGCPGGHLYVLLPAIRQEVARELRARESVYFAKGSEEDSLGNMRCK